MGRYIRKNTFNSAEELFALAPRRSVADERKRKIALQEAHEIVAALNLGN
jgi:hypothetical protein